MPRRELMGEELERHRVWGFARKGVPLTEEHRTRIGAANRGKRRSLEVKSTQSLRQKGKSLSPNAYAAAKVVLTGRARPPEVKQKISIGNLGKSRHSSKPISAETRKKLRLANLGKHHNEASRLKVSATKRAQHLSSWSKGLTKETEPRLARAGRLISARLKGRLIPLDVVEKIATKNRGGHRTAEQRKNISNGLKDKVGWSRGLTKSTDQRLMNLSRAVSKTLTGHAVAVLTRQRISDSNTGHKMPEELKEYYRNLYRGRKPWNTGLTQEISPGLRAGAAKNSVRSRERWSDPAYKHRVVQAMFRAACRHPNSLELHVLSLLDQHFPGEWEYVGNGKLVIGGLVPDFATMNGKKVLIEVFGDYWHRGEDPQERIQKFADLGYKCLVIWETEVRKTPDAFISAVGNT